MTSANRRLPDDDILARDAAQGMSLQQIAMRYHVSKDHIRRRLKVVGKSAPLSPCISLVEDERRIVIERRVTAAEFGGSANVRISLPRIGMHVAYRQNPRGVE